MTSALIAESGTTPLIGEVNSLIVNCEEQLNSANGINPDSIITGGSSNEALTGGAGADVISRLGGDDTLFGGAGNDTLADGGNGDDVFGLDATSGSLTIEYFGANGDADRIGATELSYYFADLLDLLEALRPGDGQSTLSFDLDSGDVYNLTVFSEDDLEEGDFIFQATRRLSTRLTFVGSRVDMARECGHAPIVPMG
ncbi:hypothetical protein [Sulfitobacter sp.]|uniref:hypothetical protein n=1 Tax=Sulfitobacter sp. TaxID=1903071 RepID=UPI00300169B1